MVKTALAASLLIASIGAGIFLGLQFVAKSPSGAAVAPSVKPNMLPVAATVSVTPEPASLPERLVIPELNISASVEHVGLDEKKNMDVPKDHQNVAWYQYGPPPGEVGNSVIAGHLDSETGPAVFYNLETLQAGDEVQVINEKGETNTFRVTRKEKYAFDAFPIAEVFGNTSASHLNLITCEGSFDAANRNYSHRTVVYTELIK